jgi:hypothetical protein
VPAADGAAPCAAGARHRLRRPMKKKVVPGVVALVGSAHQPGGVPPQPAPLPLVGPVVPPSTRRTLKAQSSRERSPHRVTPSASTSNASEVQSRFAVDDIVTIVGLQSRPDLSNSRCPEGGIVCLLRVLVSPYASSLSLCFEAPVCWLHRGWYLSMCMHPVRPAGLASCVHFLEVLPVSGRIPLQAV